VSGEPAERAMRVMKDHNIGVRVLGGGWWPDISWSTLSLEQRSKLSQELGSGMDQHVQFGAPEEAVMRVAEILGLANFP